MVAPTGERVRQACFPPGDRHPTRGPRWLRQPGAVTASRSLHGTEAVNSGTAAVQSDQRMPRRGSGRPGRSKIGPVDVLAADLQQYLKQSRDSLLRTLDDLSDYDVRRPVMPSGTNLLGLVKHLTGIEASYLGDCVGRPALFRLPWVDDGSIWDSADMWATADQSRDYIVDLYLAAWAHSDAAIADLPLDFPAAVSWWPEERRATTFGHLLVRVVAETAQHAGHAEIIRETIDGRSGRDRDNIGDARWWDTYVRRIQAVADTFG